MVSRAPRPGGVPRAAPASLDHYRPAIYRFIRRRGFSREEADDLTQETLLRAYAHLPRAYSAHLSAWLYRIAANLCVDESRRRRLTTVPLTDDDGVATGEDPVTVLERLERAQALRHVIGGLAPCHQQIIQLRYYDELSLADIAGRVHCTPMAAKLRVFRAVTALRKRVRAGL